MNNYLWISILIIVTIIIILTSIFIIYLLWKNQTFSVLSEKNISIKDIIQTTTSIIAILIASYALTKDSIRDKESSIRYKESIETEKIQHNEIIKVYDEQKELLLKYKESSDLMLEQLKMQAKIAKQQFENQKILTQPGVNINFQAQDTLNTNLEFENNQWLMPEVILQLHNFGGRIAKNVKTKIKFISPNTRMVHEMSQQIDPFLYPNAKMLKYNFPVINIQDRNFFMLVVELEWKDKFNNNKKEKRILYQKCLRENNGFYTIGTANGEHLDLIKEILANPSKTINPNKIIRKYMYDTYNK
ncbi:MAG: hypothetical protein R3342_13300 [Lutibacter sp.]|uniref:hypothetical protein n=1 Tax=Lutibacter sp. TaxID=1925666 RepID=UPI00299DD5D4|nr:hypothetical protein [Lutibacter sp.]MDX1830510.1 hypothetical protein [Lutibacter sp.]